jgi:hypothetical protein
MNIREISKPVTAASLNESLARKFGQKINLESFTLEQLQNARNKIRTKLSQVETNESFSSVQNETYQKSKLFLDVLNAAISERDNIAEAMCKDCGKSPCCCDEDVKEADHGKRPDSPDLDNDGDTEEPIAQAAKQAKKKKTAESVVTEGEEDKAELVMAAKDMVDRVTGWMEDTAEMQTESMLELADAIRDEHGSQISEQFTASVKPSLESMYAAMESTRQTLTQGVGMLTGEGGAPMMGADPMAADAPMEPPVDDTAAIDAAADEFGDEFEADAAAAGGTEEAGRAKRESKQYSKKKIAEQSRKLATTLLKKK